MGAGEQGSGEQGSGVKGQGSGEIDKASSQQLTIDDHKDSWRLIPLLDASGEVQMAIDRWLFERHLQGKHPPTLRFYTWSPVAISLGYHQNRSPAFWQELTWQGRSIDLVRRPTGGRAVLHQGDLSYAIVTSGMSGKRAEAYRFLCQFLIEAWQALGVELRYGVAERGYIHHPSCFTTATSADLITADGQKLIGSAQLRQGNTILQHGSMLLATEPKLYNLVFNEPAPRSSKITIPLQTLIEELIRSASRCFGVDLIDRPLSPLEWEEILADGH